MLIITQASPLSSTHSIYFAVDQHLLQILWKKMFFFFRHRTVYSFQTVILFLSCSCHSFSFAFHDNNCWKFSISHENCYELEVRMLVFAVLIYWKTQTDVLSFRSMGARLIWTWLTQFSSFKQTWSKRQKHDRCVRNLNTIRRNFKEKFYYPRMSVSLDYSRSGDDISVKLELYRMSSFHVMFV